MPIFKIIRAALIAATMAIAWGCGDQATAASLKAIDLERMCLGRAMSCDWPVPELGLIHCIAYISGIVDGWRVAERAGPENLNKSINGVSA